MAPSIETLTPAEDHPKAAPGELNHIRRFVNTHDLEDDTDSIAEPAALRDWLAERGLIDLGADEGVRVARALRVGVLRLVEEPLRDVVRHGGVRQPREGSRLPRAQAR